MSSEPDAAVIEELAQRLFARDHPLRPWRPQMVALPDAADPDGASPIERDLYRAFASRRRIEAFHEGAGEARAQTAQKTR